MYKGLLTHSLLCSKFVELTLTYMSGDATVRVEFEDDTASYAIYNLVFSQTDKQKEGGAQ